MPDPTAEELAQIAIETAKTTRNIAGLEPRVAMCSFSTKGSASHERVDKVIEATRLARELIRNVAGRGNPLIFPSLEVGNIAYKLVQRLAGAGAVGPILQGLAAPVNDLSRGATVDDIVNTIIVTCNQAIS